MSITPNEAWASKLPKVDLHLHLDGCVQPETLVELASSQGIALPTSHRNELLPYMRVGDDCDSLIQYLNKFDFVLPFLQKTEALEQVAYETVRHSASHNCRYIEVRFAPQLHTLQGLSTRAAIAHVIAGLRRGETKFGIRARAIAICMRHQPTANNLAVVEAAADYYGHGLVAVDLAGDEAGYPPELFREVFARARALGLPVTIHAGEAGGAANVAEAIDGLGATRIGHGVRLREDPALLQRVKQLGIPLEMCPISNLQTKAVLAWEDYPIRDYIAQGLTVTVNTDNPTVSGTSMTREYSTLMQHFGFTPQQLGKLTMNGVNAAFLPLEEKLLLRQEVMQQLTELGLEP